MSEDKAVALIRDIGGPNLPFEDFGWIDTSEAVTVFFLGVKFRIQ